MRGVLSMTLLILFSLHQIWRAYVTTILLSHFVWWLYVFLLHFFSFMKIAPCWYDVCICYQSLSSNLNTLSDMSSHALSIQDWLDIDFGIAEGVDFIAVSFVKSSEVINHLKSYITARSRDRWVLMHMLSALIHLFYFTFLLEISSLIMVLFIIFTDLIFSIGC